MLSYGANQFFMTMFFQTYSFQVFLLKRSSVLDDHQDQWSSSGPGPDPSPGPGPGLGPGPGPGPDPSPGPGPGPDPGPGPEDLHHPVETFILVPGTQRLLLIL